MRARLNQIQVQNIYSQAKDEEVRRLLESIGPLVYFKPKREQEIKFSAEAEYYDEYNAQVAVNLLNGYKFYNRDLKVKLQGNPTVPKILPYPIEKVSYKTSNTYEIQSVSEQLDEFYNNLTMNKKVAIITELKQVYNSREKQGHLADLLKVNSQMADLILKIQTDVLKEFKPNTVETIAINQMYNQDDQFQYQHQFQQQIPNHRQMQRR